MSQGELQVLVLGNWKLTFTAMRKYVEEVS